MDMIDASTGPIIAFEMVLITICVIPVIADDLSPKTKPNPLSHASNIAMLLGLIVGACITAYRVCTDGAVGAFDLFPTITMMLLASGLSAMSRGYDEKNGVFADTKKGRR